MIDKRKGIVDPWRKVEPLTREPSPAPREGRKDLDEVDRDADLAVPGRYVIRSKHASFDVVSIRVASPKDALEVLADCIVALWNHKRVRAQLVGAGIGAETTGGACNVPSPDVAASTLKCNASTIWFVEKPFDQGMLVLARILRAPTAAPIVKQFGITPMLNT